MFPVSRSRHSAKPECLLSNRCNLPNALKDARTAEKVIDT